MQTVLIQTILLVRPRVPNPMSARSNPKLRLVPMPPDEVDKSAEFKKWLALFFIERGNYKITNKGYAELAPQVKRQNLEFGEPVSDRKREPRLDGTMPLTIAEIRETVAAKVEEMLEQGKAEELHDNKYIIRSNLVGWDNKKVRVTVIKKLLEFLGANQARLDELRKELDGIILESCRTDQTDTKRMNEIVMEIRRNLERIRGITQDDFKNNGLGGLLVRKEYKCSPYLALVEAGYACSEEETLQHAKAGAFGTGKLYRWEMIRVGNEFWQHKENRVVATKWLIWKLNKNPREITQNDFYNNGLGGLLVRPEYKGSPYLALVEAGYAYSEDEIKEQNEQFKTDKIYPWEMTRVPFIYHDKELRIVAIRWLIWKLNKNPREITQDDFKNNGLGGVISKTRIQKFSLFSPFRSRSSNPGR